MTKWEYKIVDHSNSTAMGYSNEETEAFKIEYKDGGAVFVPIDKTGLVHRYINVGGGTGIEVVPRLWWRRPEAAASRSVFAGGKHCGIHCDDALMTIDKCS